MNGPSGAVRSERLYLGVEIGGTKLQLGVGPGDGTVRVLERLSAESTAAAILRQIRATVASLVARSGLRAGDIAGAAIGFGGPVDAESGRVARSHQVSGWESFPLAAWFERELGWATVLANDADTAGLAETRFGAARGCSPVFYVTIGSGIGGGLILDGQIYRGAGAGAAEIGHLVLPPPLRSLEGSRTEPLEPVHTVESICSGWSIARRARERIEQARTERDDRSGDAAELVARAGGRADSVTAETVADAARAGNRLAQATLEATWCVLGWAIGQAITLVCPRRVVVGGGVSLLGEELLFAPLRREVARYAFPPFAGCYDIVPAALGEPVVLHGALALARDRFGVAAT
jgi:glucokinase